jgi:hypothetical protein
MMAGTRHHHYVMRLDVTILSSDASRCSFLEVSPVSSCLKAGEYKKTNAKSAAGHEEGICQ